METKILSKATLLSIALSCIGILNSCISGESCVECMPDLTETVTLATLRFVPTDHPTDTIRATLNDPTYVEVFSGVGETATLQPNTSYYLSLDLWNEQRTPPVHISTKILNESIYHQFFYTIPSNLDLQLQYADTDTAGTPIGLQMTAQTGAASSDTLGIVMMLEEGGKDNNPATGKQEIDVRFPIIIN